jgi:hypothetical protein
VTDAPLPVQVVSRGGSLERRRLTVLFRWLLVVPHLLWWWLWGMAALAVLPWHWLWTLITATPQRDLHAFYGSYVRYSVHLWAYLSLTAGPYPGFLGAPGYPVDLEVAPVARQSRWRVALRLPLAIPPLLLARVLVGADQVGALTTIAVLAWFACLVRGRTTPGFRDLGTYCIGYAAQAYGYLVLLGDRYPDSAPARARPEPAPPHPVRAALVDDGRRSRLTTLFRAPLTAPHLVWLALWGIAALLAAVVNWLCVLIGGRSVGPLHDFLAAYLRYQAHVAAFLWLVANPFPGFVGARGSFPYEIQIDPPAPQHRAVTLLRLVLVIPALLVASALGTAQVGAGIGAWWVALITGRMPVGLRDLGAFCIRYNAQVNAYLLTVTDRYPYSGPTLETRAASGGWEPPVAPTPTSLSAPEAIGR